MNNDNNENIPERKNKQFMHIRDIIKCCDDALKINPNNTVTLYNMGKCFLEQENINYVYNIIEKIKNVDDKNSFVNILEGHIFLKKGCFVEAYRQFLQSFVNIKYNDVFLAYGIGILFEAMENFNLSKIWYKHILQTNIELFKFLEITFRLAVCFKKENKLVDALDCFYWLLNSIKINYFEHEVELQIAHVFERLNEIDKCLEIIDKLKLKNKNIILVNRLYCWVLYKTGCFQKFKDLFKCRKEVIVEKIRFDKNFDKDENEGDLYKQSSLDEIKGENKEFFKSMFKQFNKNEGDLYKQSSLDEIKSENKEFYNDIYKKFDKNSGDLYKQSSLDEIKSESKEFNNSIYKKIDKNKNNEFNNDIYKYNNKDIDKTAYREKLDNNNINNKEMIKEPTFYNNENKNMSFNEQINTQFIKKTFINNEFYDKFKKDNYFFKEEIMKDKIFFKR
ncbi:transcriptional corepressor cyc8 [Vairimorpha apis BRL 01]|uniref:Transcriptional corepressor cyc8 n=1 Tax=Vairimorpha apis BRL 01 TaxID=1037528 RepID=T0MJ79_9MICR|nr:transcriptional corepressor cyc8 [Vairimorpha apis BRL 01]